VEAAAEGGLYASLDPVFVWAACYLFESAGVEGVEADVDASEAGLLEAAGFLFEEAGVGGHGDFYVGGYAAHYLDYVVSHEGFAARELYLGDAEAGGYFYGCLYLVWGELGAWVVFSFLVAEEAVEVASLG
jgi:hypothetical protein